MKKIYKYATGDVIPDGAIYLCTVTQNHYLGYSDRNAYPEDSWLPCWLVWHYFLVEVKE